MLKHGYEYHNGYSGTGTGTGTTSLVLNRIQPLNSHDPGVIVSPGNTVTSLEGNLSMHLKQGLKF